MGRRAFLLSIVVTAVISAGLALLIGRQLEPPSTGADAAAPDPSRITVPVERRLLSSNVVARGTIEFSDSRSLRVETNPGDVPVVTAAPGDVGSELSEGDLLLEIGYRPVMVLEGELPMFRSIGPGSEGEDVEQLEAALKRLGFDPGPVDGTYDTSTEQAVSAWYTQTGYEPPTQSRSEKDALKLAEDAVDQAKDDLAAASTSLKEAKTGPSQAERLSLQLAVDEAAASVRDIRNAGSPRLEIRRAEATLVQAKESQYNALRTDTSGEAKNFVDGQDRVLRAELDLAELQRTSGLQIPRAEIVFVPSLPRRIEVVKAKKGEILVDAEIVSVSSAEVQITASVTAADRPLISEGDRVLIIDDGVGLNTEGEISFIADQPGGLAPDGKFNVRVVPAGDEAAAFQGLNVKLTVPVESTDGDVLAVPAAALSATTDGSIRIEIEHDDETTRYVTVEAGLSSGGYVEVAALDGDLSEGDRAVIGFEDGSVGAAATSTADDASEQVSS